MTNVQITNGAVKYGRTVKTGDFESKRGDVELSFNIPEGEDVHQAIQYVKHMAHTHCHELVGCGEDKLLQAPAKPVKPKPKLMPKVEQPADPVEVDDPLADRAPLPAKAPDAATVEEVPPLLKKEVAAQKVMEEDLGDLIGGSAEITDKELMDATQKCQAAAKNAPAIRKIVNDLGVKSPPGRIIDLPQDKRAVYLEKLKEVKPLA